jgi:hypothetical protein
MIEIKLVFSNEDAISIFRNAGLLVEMHDFPIYFGRYHGDKEDLIPMLAVKNPHNDKMEKLEPIFRKYMEAKKKELFLTPEKLDIYNLFK